jgi:hypothetical protein
MVSPSYPLQQHIVGVASYQGHQQYFASAPPLQALYMQAESVYPDMHKEPGGIYPQPGYEWYTSLHCAKRIAAVTKISFDWKRDVYCNFFHMGMQIWVQSLTLRFSTVKKNTCSMPLHSDFSLLMCVLHDAGSVEMGTTRTGLGFRTIDFWQIYHAHWLLW